MSLLESLLLLAVVAGLFGLAIGIVIWAGKSGEAGPGFDGGAGIEQRTILQGEKGLRRENAQDELDRELERVEREEAEAAAAQGDGIEGAAP
jgi:hypothetical protein